MLLTGCFTALVTPMSTDGSIDYPAYQRLIERQATLGVDGFVIGGTTGESPTLSTHELRTLTQTALDATDLPLIINVGTNCTQKTLDSIDQLKDLDVAAYLAVTPYYNRPPQAGLLHHFHRLADHAKKPLILYDVPKRTGVSLSTETIITLAQHPNIIGLKDASGDIERCQLLKRSIPEFLMLSGDDDSFTAFMQAGGDGIISVTSHLIPSVFKQLLKDPSSDDTILKRCNPLLAQSTNPIMIKAMLHINDLIPSGIRSPLVMLDNTELSQLKSAMEKEHLRFKEQHGML